MEKQPLIHHREDEFLDGSTVQRAPVLNSLISDATAALPAAIAPVGSTFSANAGGMKDAAVAADDAKTVIRRPDVESTSKGSPTGAPATPASVASVLLGTRLNHFLLEELIGGGGMGAVFRARDDRLDRIVAIKVIPFVGEDQDLQRRFRNEAQNAARLDHPYIARVFDVGQFEQWHYLVFEYVDGINLRDMVARDGVLPIDDAVYYTRQIAEAIEHANSRGIVHRDIKPSNVLVDTDGNVKVVDMGLARSQQIEVSGDMTASGVTLGTFDYISPEQARDPRDADVRSDIYSLGCTLYYLLTASPPYPGGTMLQKLLSHGNSPPPDPRGLRPEVSDNLTAIIHKMLAKDPAARYPRAIDVVADLRELALREGLVRAQTRGTLTIAPSDPIPRFLTQHLPWMVATALLFLVAAGLKVSSAFNRDQFLITQPVSAKPLSDPARSEARDADVSKANRSIEQVIASDATGSNELLPSMETLKRSLTERDEAAIPPQFSGVAMPAESNKPISRSDDVKLSPPVPIKRIVVAGSSTDPSAKIVQSLREAIRLAGDMQVNLIEIATNIVVNEPIVVNSDSLVIRSVVGTRNEIRFVTDKSLAMQRVKMFDIGTHRIEMQNLDFLWSVRSEAIEGGALFGIANSNELVKLANCTITIENLAERDEVFAFEITEVDKTVAASPSISPVTRTPSLVGTDLAASAPLDAPPKASPEALAVAQTDAFALVVIKLENVAARGEMTFINLVDAAQLQLEWTNGLLAVSHRMLEAAGAPVRPEVGRAQIQLKLDQVTAWTPDGLARIRLGQSGTYPMTIDRNCTRSVFHNAPLANHLEFEKLDPRDADPSVLVQIRGEDNAYDFSLAREAKLLTLQVGSGIPRVFSRDDVTAPEQFTWFSDRSPRWAVRWTDPAPPAKPSRQNATHSQLTTKDFYQDGILNPGFDVNSLPEFPLRTTFEPEI